MNKELVDTDIEARKEHDKAIGNALSKAIRANFGKNKQAKAEHTEHHEHVFTHPDPATTGGGGFLGALLANDHQ